MYDNWIWVYDGIHRFYYLHTEQKYICWTPGYCIFNDIYNTFNIGYMFVFVARLCDTITSASFHYFIAPLLLFCNNFNNETDRIPCCNLQCGKKKLFANQHLHSSNLVYIVCWECTTRCALDASSHCYKIDNMLF